MISPAQSEASKSCAVSLAGGCLRVCGALAILLLAGCSIPGVDKRSPGSIESQKAYEKSVKTNASPVMPLPETNQVRKAFSLALVLPPPKTNPVVFTPKFRYPKGAETNWWDLQRRTDTRGPWVTIVSGFYGTNGGVTMDWHETNALAEFRMVGHK